MILYPHMQKVKGKNTGPELKIRKILCGLGFKGYRLHVNKLPGKPDIVFTKRKKIIFIHGCFWHGHTCKSGMNRPKSNKEYWDLKFLKNISRDEKYQKQLKNTGWDVLIVWECQIRDLERVSDMLCNFMAS